MHVYFLAERGGQYLIFQIDPTNTSATPVPVSFHPTMESAVTYARSTSGVKLAIPLIEVPYV